MNRVETYIRNRHEDAHHRRCEAESKMLAGLDEGEDIASQVAAVAAVRAIASWWDEPIIGIDHEAWALGRARQAACRVLTDPIIPRHADPFAQGFALARIEAARTFYRNTAHLDALITPRSSS